MTNPPALLADLASAGWSVSSIWDLVNTRERYPAAIPVLIDWLEHLDSRIDLGQTPPERYDKFREGLVRAVTVPYARPFPAEILITEFRKPAHYVGVRDAIANAISMLADRRHAAEVLELAQDEEFGGERAFIVNGLGKTSLRSPEAKAFLLEILESGDTNLLMQAMHALEPYHCAEARPLLQQIARTHPEPIIRRRAEQSLKRYQGSP